MCEQTPPQPPSPDSTPKIVKHKIVVPGNLDHGAVVQGDDNTGKDGLPLVSENLPPGTIMTTGAQLVSDVAVPSAEPSQHQQIKVEVAARLAANGVEKTGPVTIGGTHQGRGNVIIVGNDKTVSEVQTKGEKVAKEIVAPLDTSPIGTELFQPAWVGDVLEDIVLGNEEIGYKRYNGWELIKKTVDGSTYRKTH